MAHFAKIDENNIVIQVVVVDDSITKENIGITFPQSEILGSEFLNSHSETLGNWKQTSYNNNFRKQYASIGFKYDEKNDVFIAPKPDPSENVEDFVLNENFDWVPTNIENFEFLNFEEQQ
jgi:hypothetical protein